MIAQNVFSKEDHVDNVENEEDYKEYNYFKILGLTQKSQKSFSKWTLEKAKVPKRIALT